MWSRLVAANPLRAKARVAASRICSRRSARRSRRAGAVRVSTIPTPCISESLQVRLFKYEYTKATGVHDERTDRAARPAVRAAATVRDAAAAAEPASRRGDPPGAYRGG